MGKYTYNDDEYDTNKILKYKKHKKIQKKLHNLAP